MQTSSRETLLSIYVHDLDYASLYPSIMRALNQSRMTMTFAPISIEGLYRVEVERYFGNLINIRENAEQLCSSYHGFPSYEEMKQIVLNEIVNN